MKTTKKDMQRRIMELESQLVHQYHFADIAIQKAGEDRLMGGGVILQLTANGGREIVAPVMIKDGLSAETIKAIRNDLKRSYDLAVLFKPEGAIK